MTIESPAGITEDVLTPELDLQRRLRNEIPEGFVKEGGPIKKMFERTPDGRTTFQVAVAGNPDLIFVPVGDGYEGWFQGYVPEAASEPQKTGMLRKIGRFLGNRHDA